jgi:hypothetical protein
MMFPRYELRTPQMLCSAYGPFLEHMPIDARRQVSSRYWTANRSTLASEYGQNPTFRTARHSMNSEQLFTSPLYREPEQLQP